jgi:hypothetical protein
MSPEPIFVEDRNRSRRSPPSDRWADGPHVRRRVDDAKQSRNVLGVTIFRFPMHQPACADPSAVVTRVEMARGPPDVNSYVQTSESLRPGSDLGEEAVPGRDRTIAAAGEAEALASARGVVDDQSSPSNS